jgi:hypothetical protein
MFLHVCGRTFLFSISMGKAISAKETAVNLNLFLLQESLAILSVSSRIFHLNH